MDNVHDYDGVEEEPAADQQAILNNLVEQLVLADAEEAELEEKLKVASKKARDLRENMIPEQMRQMGLLEITTAAGVKVVVKEDIRASFFAKDPTKREPAFEWLRDNGHDGLIKNVVSAQFDKDQGTQAEAFLEYCKKFSVPIAVDQKRDINNQTLCAFLRSEAREGHVIPLELFGATKFHTTKLTFKK